MLPRPPVLRTGRAAVSRRAARRPRRRRARAVGRRVARSHRTRRSQDRAVPGGRLRTRGRGSAVAGARRRSECGRGRRPLGAGRRARRARGRKGSCHRQRPRCGRGRSSGSGGVAMTTVTRARRCRRVRVHALVVRRRHARSTVANRNDSSRPPRWPATSRRSRSCSHPAPTRTRSCRSTATRNPPGFSRSPRFVRSQPALVEIVKLMLKAGADPNEVWGTAVGPSGPGSPPGNDSFPRRRPAGGVRTTTRFTSRCDPAPTSCARSSPRASILDMGTRRW